jgi:hypothetical protein
MQSPIDVKIGLVTLLIWTLLNRAARFFSIQGTKIRKHYKTYLTLRKANDQTVYQMVIKYIKIFPFKAFQNLPKLRGWGGVGIKIYHLATLLLNGRKATEGAQ